MLIQAEAELGHLPALPPGALVERHAPGADISRYYSVGAPQAPVRARLGLNHANVWLRESERAYILSKRPNLFSDLERAIGLVLHSPLSVHRSNEDPDAYYFLCEGDTLRKAGLLHSRRTRFVDLVIARQSTAEDSYVRVIHCSPTTRNFGARRLWP